MDQMLGMLKAGGTGAHSEADTDELEADAEASVAGMMADLQF